MSETTSTTTTQPLDAEGLFDFLDRWHPQARPGRQQDYHDMVEHLRAFGVTSHDQLVALAEELEVAVDDERACFPRPDSRVPRFEAYLAIAHPEQWVQRTSAEGTDRRTRLRNHIHQYRGEPWEQLPSETPSRPEQQDTGNATHFYTSLISGSRRIVLTGPYPTKKTAEADLPRIRSLVEDARHSDPALSFAEWGTAGSAQPIPEKAIALHGQDRYAPQF